MTTVHRELAQLLTSYQSEKEESRRDDDTYFIGYWDSACQTSYDVAAALSMSLEGQDKQAEEGDQKSTGSTGEEYTKQHSRDVLFARS